ncbi:MAG: alginate lyase family protein [Bryobacterales bacterium]|nr:alginate lyase family protein [Bryobacterales bacterium]
MQINRRQALAAIGTFALPLKAQRSEVYLFISQPEIEAAKEKAKRCDWAAVSLKDLLGQAEQALAKPMEIPDRGGQWGHWYSCPKDGVALVAESPTRHRCPKCGAVYTGEPYDSVYVAHQHMRNSAAMRDMGLAFRFTGRQEFASRVSQLLLGYAERYASYPRHDPNGKDTVNSGRVMSQTLDESSWLLPAAWGYALVRGTLSARQQRQIEYRLLIGAVDTIVGRSYARLPNIQCWKDAAIASVGFTTANDDLVAEALDHPVRGFRVLMEKYALPCGIWGEASLGYHQYTLLALWHLAEGARRYGIDLYSNQRYRGLFDGPIAMAFPDNTLPGFNDNPGAPLKDWAAVYELAYARWKDPRYGQVAALAPREGLMPLLYGADTLPEGSPVPKTSVLLREAGYGVLRSPEVTVAGRFGIHGSGHGHPDKLNILTYGNGKLFGVDPGSINYGVPLFFEWYKATISHNTVSVDQQQQARADAKVTVWRTNGEGTELQGETEVYPGVKFRRTLRLHHRTMEDRFDCESENEHVYDWGFHSMGTLEVTLPLKPRAEPIATVSGYQHIKDLREAATDDEWTASWTQGSAQLKLRVKGVPGTVVYTGKGPGPDPAQQVSMILIRRRGRAASFEVTHTYGKIT